jgi:hypothetical protein
MQPDDMLGILDRAENGSSGEKSGNNEEMGDEGEKESDEVVVSTESGAFES